MRTPFLRRPLTLFLLLLVGVAPGIAQEPDANEVVAPELLQALDWRMVVAVSSVSALLGGVIALAFGRDGPYDQRAPGLSLNAARQAFGEQVVQHYVHFFRTEQTAYDDAVTDWERRRYFERI